MHLKGGIVLNARKKKERKKRSYFSLVMNGEK